MKRTFTVINWLIGLSIIIFLTYYLDLSLILNQLKTVELQYVFYSFMLGIPIIGSAILAFYSLIVSINYPCSLRKLFYGFCKSWIIGLVGLGKAGELSIIYFLRKKDGNIGEISAITIIDKLITFMSLLFLAVLGTLFYFPSKIMFLFILFITILAIIFIILTLSNKSRTFIKKYLLRQFQGRFQNFSTTFNLLINNKGGIFINFILTIIKWTLTAISTLLLFMAMDLTASIWFIILVEAVITLIGLLPISVNGLGTKEATATFLFSIIGINSSSIFALYLLRRFLNILLGLIFGIIFLKKKDY